MDPLGDFNYHLGVAVKSKNGKRLDELLRMHSPEANAATEAYVLNGGDLPSGLPEPWNNVSELVKDRFAAGSALNASNWVECCMYLSRAVHAYLTILSKDDGWSLPVLQSMCRELRTVAVEADNQLQMEGMRACKLIEVERVLKRAFSVTNNDRRTLEENTRKLGTLDVINQLLKVYFKLNNLRLCSNVVKVVNAPNFPDFEATFPISHRVAYKYFSGRLHMYADRRPEAVADLTYAFEKTPDTYEANKRLELLYLIPAKILCGSFPSMALLDRYKMEWYKGIVQAVRTGNLRVFDETLAKYEEFFIKKALFLTMEKLRQMVYRALCRRLSRIKQTNKVMIDDYRVCLKFCGADVDKNEAECILANLIYNNIIRGYISHKVGVLVLSKKNAFPKISL